MTNHDYCHLSKATDPLICHLTTATYSFDGAWTRCVLSSLANVYNITLNWRSIYFRVIRTKKPANACWELISLLYAMGSQGEVCCNHQLYPKDLLHLFTPNSSPNVEISSTSLEIILSLESNLFIFHCIPNNAFQIKAKHMPNYFLMWNLSPNQPQAAYQYALLLHLKVFHIWLQTPFPSKRTVPSKTKFFNKKRDDC